MSVNVSVSVCLLMSVCQCIGQCVSVSVSDSDSEYYSHDSFASIQEKLKSNVQCQEFCIMGDMNSRFGPLVHELSNNVELPNHESYSYPVVPDDIRVSNDNALILSNICKESRMLMLNNLKTPVRHFIGKKTYRKGREWVSELDACFVSPSVLSRVTEFSVLQNESLPSDHAPITITMTLPGVDMEALCDRAQYLGDHAVLYNVTGMNKNLRKPLCMKDIDAQAFLNNLELIDLPIGTEISNITDNLYQCVCRSRRAPQVQESDVSLGRWDRLLENKDDLQLWKAINWKGEYNSKSDPEARPSDDDFKQFYESNFCPPDDLPLNDYDFTTDVYIPVLDDPITPLELQQQSKLLKSDKACGPDGVPPGIFKIIPAQWIVFLSSCFNNIFISGIYPQEWARARLVPIFKKGNKEEVKNYRGISIMNSIAKFYDMVLYSRLKQWFRPYREQAGSQEKRGCLEHIVTLRLLCDMARRKKLKLFVTFVDFSQAYDRVPRHILFKVLRRLGCGSVMLSALIAIYTLTESWLGTAVIVITLGVRQGSPTSCLLFTVLVDDLIRMVKEGCEFDGFLQWLHILVLMDDTVLISTTRCNIIKKVSILQEYCNEYGMKVNQSKTKFFVINGSETDLEALIVNELVVEHCEMYIYLGSPFTSDGSVSSAVKVHANIKMSHVLKFVSFISKNNDVPFVVKKRVFEAALMSSLVYGCESWLAADLKPMIKLYNWCLKRLLGVRKSTCNDVCYVEAGYPPLQDLVRYKQHKFVKAMWQDRYLYDDDPLVFVIKVVKSTTTCTGKMLRDFLNNDVTELSEVMQRVRNGIIDSNTSRRITYKAINPDLSTHYVYKEKHNINERDRLSFTQFRVSGHSLACETGRWNRRGRGRLPLEERLCSCGNIQTERHTVEDCPLTHRLRSQYQFSSMEQLFSDQFNPEVTCRIIYELLNTYRS